MSANSKSKVIVEKVKPRRDNYLIKTYDKTIISGVKQTPKGNLIVSFRNVFLDPEDVVSPFNAQDYAGTILKKYMLKELLKNDIHYIWRRVDYIHFDKDRVICRTQGPKSLQFGPLSFYIAMIDLDSGKVTWINEELIKQENLEIYYNDENHLPLVFKRVEINHIIFNYINFYEKVSKIFFYKAP